MKLLRLLFHGIVAVFSILSLDLSIKADSRPNILIIMVDDMGFAGPSIEPYGNPHYQTPGMDQLAREGLRFSDFHSSGNVIFQSIFMI